MPRQGREERRSSNILSKLSLRLSDTRKSITSASRLQMRSVQVSVFTFTHLFKLAAEPVWYVTMLIANYLAIIWITLGSLDARCAQPDSFNSFMVNEFIYALDVLYFFDIVIAIGCKFIPGFELDVMDKVVRPAWMLIIEVFAVIPFEFFSSGEKPEDQRLFCMLKLTKVLRFVRIVYYYFQNRNFIDSKILLRLVGMVSVEILIIMIAYSIYCNASCYSGMCVDTACDNFDAIVALTACLTSSGLSRFPDTLLWNVLTTVLMCATFYCVTLLTTCDVALEFMEAHVEKVLFVRTYSNVVRRYHVWKSPNFIKDLTHSYFNTVWKMRYGYNEHRFTEEDLPMSFKLDMVSDVYWEIYKHSHMFRYRSQAFLREVSTIVKQEFRLPGEMLWIRGQWKSKMIYVVSGTIQLLSEEDGESPVLSLTSGTCLGDSCLFTGYKSRDNVRCKGFCEIYSIHKSDFARIYIKFPVEYKISMVSIDSRYRNAIQHIELNVRSKANSQQKLDTYALLWIKNTLHKHMSVDKETMRRHRFQNIYLLNEVNPTDLKRVMFMADYLDTLAIAERLEIDTDSVFLKPSFPCILQPNSFLVAFWEFFIISVTLFICILVPRQACMHDVELPWFGVVLDVVTFMFFLDIGVQMSIGVTTRERVLASFYEIARARMSTWTFLLDVISCFPLEIFQSIACTELTRQAIAVLYLNRLSKIWRIEAMLNAWEKKFHANFLLIHFVRYIFRFAALTFFVYCILNRIRPDMMHHEQLFIAIQLITNGGIALVTLRNRLMCVFGNLMANVLHSVMIAHFISANALLSLNKIIVRQYVESLREVLKTIPRFSKMINEYLFTQWQDNHCEKITSRFNNLPQSLHGDMILHLAKEQVENLPLFTILPSEIVYDIVSTVFKYRLFSPNELVVKTGDIVPYAIMVYGGVSEVLNTSGDLQELDASTYMVNFAEASLRTQSATTIICTTHCKALYFHIGDFEMVLRKYPYVWADYKKVMKDSYDLKLRIRQICESEADIGLLIREGSRNGKSWYTFSKNFKKDSYAEYDYYIPYDKLFPFNFVRYFLLRTVFLPDGDFLVIWEAVRCGCAILTCILFFSYPFVSQYSKVGFLLDFTCLADMYVRLHVAYYDPKGILITHPTQTAKYYITHSFIIDFCGFLPLSYFTSTDAFGYFTLHFLRLLQLYRYIRFMQCLRVDPTKRVSKWLGVMYIPLALVIINLFGTLLVTLECFQEIGALMCMEGVMIVTSNIHWFSDVYIHISGVFVAATSFLSVGMGTYQIQSKLSSIMISVICLLGVYFKALVISHVLTMYSFKNKTLSQYQDSIHSLKRFLKLLKTDKKLQKGILDACELQWKNLKSRDINTMTAPISGTLRIDMIYDYFGEELFQNSVFAYKRRSFYRNLVNKVSDDTYPKDGYVTTINDITKNTLLLYRGTVDVVAPDGSHLTTLSPGSIFGNLEYANYSRVKCSIVATTNIRVLSTPAKYFHELLHQYPKIRDQYNEMKWKYMSYIPAFKEEPKSFRIATPPTRTKKTIILLRIRMFFLTIFDPYSKLAFTWQFVTLMYSCYFAILMDLYQIGAMEFSYTMLTMQYMSDVLYLFHLIGKYFSPYIDESGKVITDPKLIKRKHSQKKKWFMLYYISLIPLDFLVMVFMTTKPLKYFLFALFRLNRMLRFAYIIHYFHNIRHRIKSNVLLARFCYIILWMCALVIAMASLLAYVSCMTPGSFLPLLPTCEMMSMMSTKKRMTLYMKYLSITSHFLTFSGQHVYTPQNKGMLMLCIIYSMFALYLYSMLYSKIFSVVRDGSRQRVRFREFGSRLKKYMLIEDASIALIDRVIRYVELLWFRTRGTTYPILLRDAPLYLQEAILLDAYFNLIGEHPLFENCHYDFVRQVIQKSKTEIYFMDEFVQFKGIVQATMYFIFRGSVKVIDERDSHDFTMKVLLEGDSFGVIEGLRGTKKHDYTFQVETSAVIVSLTKRDWAYLLDFYPASKEKIFKAAEYYIGDETIV